MQEVITRAYKEDLNDRDRQEREEQRNNEYGRRAAADTKRGVDWRTGKKLTTNTRGASRRKARRKSGR